MFSSPKESFPSTLPLLRGLSPQPPFPESPNHQSIDIPLSPINHGSVNDGANVEEGVSSDSHCDQGQSSSTEARKLPRAEANLKDGSETLFSMYNEKALEFDSKHIENWREDANGLMILSGLVSAAVAGFLSQTYISFQTNSQDVSAFYLSQIYQLQLSLNGMAPSPKPTAPAPAQKPVFSHVFWFTSLIMSFVCAVGATMVQEWIRRYQLLTQLRSGPHHRQSARLRASISQDLFLELIPIVLKGLNALLHVSIYMFLFGLAFLPYYLGDMLVLSFSITFFCLGLIGYTFFFFGLIFRPRVLFIFPTLLIYKRGLDAFSGSTISAMPSLLFAAQEIEKDDSTRISTLDAEAMSWLFDSLTEEDDFERFLSGIPGFYESTHIEDPAKVLQKANTDASPKAILAFMDRSISSNLPEETRQRRIDVSLEAMQTHPYLLQRSFHHAFRVFPAESAIFKCVDFVLLADQHADDEDLNTRFLAKFIIAIAVNRLEDYHTDERWAGIVKRRLNWPEDLFHREHRDSIKLRNLVQLAWESITPRPDSDTLSEEVFGNLLSEVCKLNVGNAAPKLQNEFCDLWNHLVNEAQLPLQDPVLRSNITLMLSSTRTIHVSLHQGAKSESSTSPANTTDLDPVLQNPFPYSPRTVSCHPVTSPHPSPNFSVPHDSGDA